MKDSPQVPSCDILFEVPEPTGGKVKLEEVGYWKCILGGALFSTHPPPFPFLLPIDHEVSHSAPSPTGMLMPRLWRCGASELLG